MKTIKYFSLVAIAICTGVFTACTDGNDWGTDDAYNRVMAPRISSVTGGEGSLIVSFNTYGGNKYILEANENPFPTDDLYGDVMEGSITAEVTGSPGTITNLNGYTDYYVRVRALSDEKKPSQWILFASSSIEEGAMIISQKATTTKGLQILLDVTDEDRQPNSITVHWIEGYNPTKITATFKNGEEKNVTEYELSAEDIAARTFTCTNLNASTPYEIRIYEGNNCIGMVETKTMKAPPVADYTETLTGEVLNQSIMNEIALKAKANAGDKDTYAATIIIPAGKTVTIAEGTKEVSVPAGMTLYLYGTDSSDGTKGTLQFNYKLEIGGYHGDISFENLNLTAPTSGSNTYIINQSNAASIGNITFTSCNISNINCAVIRTQGSNDISIGSVVIDDCIVTDQGTMNQSYGYVITNGGSKASISDIEIKNSTFDHCTVGIISNNTKTENKIANITVTDCTFYNCVGSGRYIADAGKNAAGTVNETNMTFKNVIVGKLFHSSAKGYQTKGNLIVDHFYQTSGTKFNGGSFKSNDDGMKLDWRTGQFTDAQLFEDPTNHNFNLKHWFEQTSADESKGIQFDIYGDPRWKQDNGDSEDDGNEE